MRKGMVVAIATLGLLVAGCGSNQVRAAKATVLPTTTTADCYPGFIDPACPQTTDTAPQTLEPTTTTSGTETVSIGREALFTRDGNPVLGITVSGLELHTSTPDGFDTSQRGHFVVVHVKIASTADGINASETDFYLREPSGTHDDATFVSGFGSNLSVTTLNKGESVSGVLVFDSASTHGRIAYAPNSGEAPLEYWTF